MQCDERAGAPERRTLSQRSIDGELVCLVEFLEVELDIVGDVECGPARRSFVRSTATLFHYP